MPREPVDHGRIVYVVPPDFPERLELLQEESGLPWAEIARRLGTYPYTVWRWYRGRARPHFRHQMALLDLADELGLAHLLTAWILPDEARREKPAKDVPPARERRACAPACPAPMISGNKKSPHTWEAGGGRRRYGDNLPP